MTAPPQPDAPKDEWRAWARREREQVDFAAVSEAVNAHLVAWDPLRTAGIVVVFFALPDEIDLRSLMEAELPVRFAATRTPDRRGSLSIHQLGGPLEVHRYGFLQPHGSAPEIDPRDVGLVLVPGLAFDLFGNRLGRGAGYYDELLSRVGPATLLVGVTPVALVVDRLPSAPHDRPVGYLATEEGVVEVA